MEFARLSPFFFRLRRAYWAYNSDNLGTKTVIPRDETAPHGVETPFPLADR